jgi:hypothetical protein
MQESQQLPFGLRLVSGIFEEFQHPAIHTKIVQHFGGFFRQIKVRQPTGKRILYKPSAKEWGDWRHLRI